MKLNLAGRTGLRLERFIISEIQKKYPGVNIAAQKPEGNKGPRMNGPGISSVLPDLQIWGVRKGWIEIKAKSEPIFFRNLHRYEHGIEKEKFEHYLDVANLTKLPVFLLIIDSDSGLLLINEIQNLKSNRMREGHWPDVGKDSVNWPIAVFLQIGRITFHDDYLEKMSVNWKFDDFEKLLIQAQFDFPLTG